MKYIAFLVFNCCLYLTASSSNYYFSFSSGNDGNAGTSTSAAYKTIAKLNSLVLVAGDTVFLKCGDTFRGQINISTSGTTVSNIVFTSYGTGNKPIITGAELITGFIQNGSKYEKVLTQKMNNFFVSDKEQTLARYPNNGRYLVLDSAQKTYLKDADLASLPANYITNSRLCVHTAQWCWEKSSVSTYNSAEKITYSTNMNLAAIANYGYFLYDNINLLDTANEWKFDSTTYLLTYMPSSGVNLNSVTCEASVYTNGIAIAGTASYITISNIQFEKQMNAGIAINSTSNKNIKIDNCYFARQYNHGVTDKGKYNEVSNCYFREVDGIAVFVSGSGAGNHTVHHSTFRNIGQYRNSGIGTEINLSAVKFGFVDSCYAHHNDIDSAGYCGISADGGYHLIEKNIVKNAMLLNNDGAALKSFAAQSHHITFRNNFVSSSDGNTEGTYNANFITPAIYFDFNVNNCIIQDNTVYNRTQKGIFQNAGDVNNSIIGNNIYGGNYGIDFNGHTNQNTADTINGYVIKKNSIFLKTANDYMYRQVDFSNTYNFGNIDSNYYFQPYSNKFIQRPGASPSTVSFTSWQTAGFDVHGKTNSFTWAAGVDSSSIFINPTDNAVQQSLGGWIWKDLDGNLVTSLTLQPWTSKILLRTATALPLSYLSFDVGKEGSTINCIWQTTNEVNVSYFNIQRSSNGKDFTTIGTTNAKNESSNQYNYTDFPPTEGLGVALYYRIEAIDYNGSNTYSSIKQIRLNDKQETKTVLIYPNPANDIVTIKSNNTLQEIKIIDVTGKLQYLNKNIAGNLATINLNSCSKGLLLVQATDTSGSTTITKLFKQ